MFRAHAKRQRVSREQPVRTPLEIPFEAELEMGPFVATSSLALSYELGDQDALEVESFLAMTGLTPSYVHGLVRAHVLDTALVLHGDSVRIRSVGLPMILLADEVAGLTMTRILSLDAAAHVLGTIWPELETLWADALAGTIACVDLGEPTNVSLNFLKRAYAQYQIALIEPLTPVSTLG